MPNEAPQRKIHQYNVMSTLLEKVICGEKMVLDGLLRYSMGRQVKVYCVPLR